MKQTTRDKIEFVRGLLIVKIPGYMTLPPGERVLQCAAYLADTLKVREIGNNRGEWVEAFLDCAGVSEGNPWCASMITFACLVAKVKIAIGPAAVRNWHTFFSGTGRLFRKPSRGMACMHNSGGGKGHIGIVVGSALGFVRSIEGNTSSGESGSQRDGDGLYRRTRPGGFWNWNYGEFVNA